MLKIDFKVSANFICLFLTHAWKRPSFYVEKWIENRTFLAFVEASRCYFSPRYRGMKSSLSPAVCWLGMPNIPFTFHAKNVLFLNLLKKVLCVTREQFSSLVAQCTISNYAVHNEFSINSWPFTSISGVKSRVVSLKKSTWPLNDLDGHG